MRPWNMVVTSLEGARAALRQALRPFGRLGGSGYRNVLVGHVDDRTVFLDAVRDALATSPILPHALGRVIPIDVTCRLGADDPTAVVIDKVLPLLDPLVANSFYVRVERRGDGEGVDSPTFERTVGDAVWQRLVDRGATPKVDFRDPDVIVAVEILGSDAGVAVLPRALRAAYPFVRVK